MIIPTIRIFTTDEWQIYKDLRLGALVEAPYAFGSSYAEESQRPDSYWARRLTNGASSEWDLPLIAEVDGQPAGLSWGKIEPVEPEKAYLYQVWVKPEFRRLGLGQMLVEAVITWAREKNARCLELGVTAGDSPAMRLYQRLGFEPCGEPQPFRPEADLMGLPMQLNLEEKIMSNISLRRLGRSGIEVSPVGFGCWAIGGPWQFMERPAGWGEVDDQESIRAIHAALENGINFFDTAANYGTGHSERILGQALAGKRQRAVIATKFGFNIDETGKRVTRFDHPAEVIRDARRSCEASLRRLGTDSIDLFQLHVSDFPVESAPEMQEELENLVFEGKIRAYGWSTDSLERAAAFAGGEHYAAVQHDLNIIWDAPEMLAYCERQDLASVNRSPLARGALTGKYDQSTAFGGDDVRITSWSMEHYFTPTLEKLDALRSILTSGGRTLAQGALCWILTRSQKTIPIPGIRSVSQLQENAAALQAGLFTPEQMDQVETLLDRSK